MANLLLDDILIWGCNIYDILHGTFMLIIATITFFLICGFYIVLRPKFKVKVNCWFCNKNSYIPYITRHCWKCPKCEQFNGFSKDGDYNKDVQKHIAAVAGQTTKEIAPQKQTQNGLCDACNEKMALKVNQLATFQPMKDENYDEEIEHFRKQLESWYKLCRQCENVLKEALQTQHYNLLTNRLNDHRKASPDLRSVYSPPSIQRRVKVNLRHVSTFILSVLTATVAVQVSKDYLPVALSDVISSSLYQILSTVFNLGFNLTKETAAIGVMSYFTSVYGNITYRDEILLVLWSVLGVLFWTDYYIILLVFSLITLVIQATSVNVQTLQFKKRDIPKTINRHFNVAAVRPTTNLSKIVANSVNKVEKTNSELKAKLTEVRRDQENSEATVNEKIHVEEVVNKIQTRSQTAKKQEAENMDCRTKRLFSPPPEVYRGLESLHITPVSSQTVDVPSKLVSHAGKWNGLRPSRFGAAISTGSQKDDGDSSRSSTPSSVYSYPTKKLSEMPDLVQTHPDSNADHNFGYSKAVSPICSKFSPPRPYGFDCDWGPYSGFFPTGYTPPYQPFSSPIGHTTVYTYTRPTNYPYSFPSQRFSPVFEPSQFFSPKMSEINDSNKSTNLFQSNCSPNKWSWTKFVMYGSLGFNIVSLIVLAVSYWW